MRCCHLFWQHLVSLYVHMPILRVQQTSGKAMYVTCCNLSFHSVAFVMMIAALRLQSTQQLAVIHQTTVQGMRFLRNGMGTH